MVYSIILSVLFVIIAGISKSICDLSEEGKLKFKPEIYWVKSKSSVNKWKNQNKNEGEKFWGSSRWFVSLTDAWHLFGLIERLSLSISYIFVGLLIYTNVWFIFMAIGCYILFASSFHMFYTYVFC